MSLESIFAEFPTRLPSGVNFLGPKRKDDIGKPPRIVWKPVSDSLSPPRGLGGRATASPIWDRQWTILAEIWGEDLTATEVLADAFLSVAQDLLSKHSYSASQAEWDVGGVTGKGVICLMSFQLRTPVLKTVIPTVPVTGFTPTFVMGDTQV